MSSAASSNQEKMEQAMAEAKMQAEAIYEDMQKQKQSGTEVDMESLMAQPAVGGKSSNVDEE